MIRTLLISTALLAAAGGAQASPLLSSPAQAETLRVSVAGKTEATVKAEISKASSTVCRDAPVGEYFACVQETYQDAMAQMARMKSLRTASLNF